MNNPKVSVVIPVYNTEAYVEQAVRSIMDQTLREIEIIIVNDGSTDGSAAVVEKLAAEDSRIQIHTQVNSGPSLARNRGIASSCGEFIYFMDSDDLLEPDTFECCYKLGAEQNLDFVFFDAESFGVDIKLESWYDYRRAKYFKRPCYSGTELMREMLDLNCYKASPCLSFIRQSYLKELRLLFHPGILHEDELFTAQLYIGAARIGAIERSFFRRRLRTGSIMTNNFSMRNLNGYMTVVRELTRIASTQNTENKELIARLKEILLRNVLRRAWQLPASTRMQLATEVVRHYPRSIDLKSLAILLFKKLLKK